MEGSEYKNYQYQARDEQVVLFQQTVVRRGTVSWLGVECGESEKLMKQEKSCCLSVH